MNEATQIASMGITTMLELMQAKDEIKRLQNIITEAEKQEPVAWMDKTGITHKHKHFEDMQPLYTRPQPKEPT
jgi:hypothetical protein